MKPLYLDMDAELSEDGVYRYTLTRRLWQQLGHDRLLETVLFVGLNPSTADARKDDPTVRREVGFAQTWGFEWILKGNLYAYRATKPTDLRAAAARGIDIVGPRNREALTWMVDRADVVVAAWGGNKLDCAGADLAGWILSLNHTRCLGVNANGSPKHPLYLPADTALEAVPV